MDRRDGRGGGVCIYIKEDIKAYEVSEKCLNIPNVEQIWCVVEMGLDKVLCRCIYRTGVSDLNNCGDIIKSIKHAHSSNINKKFTGVLICGDFDFHTIKWSDEYYGILSSASDVQAKVFLECLNDCFLHQNVIEPSFQNNIGEMTNVLDLILTECKNRVFELIHLPPLGGINHGHHIIKFK
jgi:hypothetical protein